MFVEFIPVYCVVGGAFAAGVAAIQMSQRMIAQTARARVLRTSRPRS